MKARELIAALEEFLTKVVEHRDLWSKSLNSTIPDFPIRNGAELEKQSRWLARTLGALRPYMERFDNAWMMRHPATGTQWDALDAAVGMTAVAQAKGPSLRGTIEKIDRIIGRLQTFDGEEIISNVLTKPSIGIRVFIGHGRSLLWKDLKDFLQDRLRLPWDEFNRVPVAGVTNIARLSEMLDAAAIAFLIMTGEDERADGGVQARMNVVHEAGLFQGRLGFSRAIVLLEEGCEEFSNIHGLGQIRFLRGSIKAAFEEIRSVLEREGLFNPD